MIDPTEYIYDREEVPDASLDAQQVESAVQELASLLWGFDASPVIGLYDELMASSADLSCPGVLEFGETGVDVEYWQIACQAADGMVFQGLGQRTHYDAFPNGGTYLYGEGLSLEGSISTPSGLMLSGAGNLIDYMVPLDQGGTQWVRTSSGRWTWNGEGSADTWLDGSVVPDVTVAAVDYPELGRYAYVDGGLSGLAGEIDTVTMSQMALIEAGLGGSCPQEPSGTVSLRAQDGSWYDVTFDGPTDFNTIVAPDLCDGCGTVFYRGEAIGEACVDFSVWMQWEGQPW